MMTMMTAGIAIPKNTKLCKSNVIMMTIAIIKKITYFIVYVTTNIYNIRLNIITENNILYNISYCMQLYLQMRSLK